MTEQTDQSIEELLKGETSWETIIPHRGVETTIFFEEGKGYTLTTAGVTLGYEEDRLKENPEAYISEQLTTLQHYEEGLRGHLSDYYGDMNEKFEKEGDLNRAFQFIPEGAGRMIINTIQAPLFWLNGRTLKSVAHENIGGSEMQVSYYRIIKDAIESGTSFFERVKEQYGEQLSTDATTQLEQCLEITGMLTHLYSNLIRTAEKEVAYHQRTYDFLFPKA